jgi:uncharacterized protein (TIGR01777 family)
MMRLIIRACCFFAARLSAKRFACAAGTASSRPTGNRSNLIYTAAHLGHRPDSFRVLRVIPRIITLGGAGLRSCPAAYAMKIVLAGATGFLGRPLTEALAADGHELVGLTRKPRSGGGFREVAWQPDGTAGPWAAEIDGADVVVNLAGESIAGGRWTAGRKRALRDSRLRSTASLVAAIDRAARRPALLLSSSAVGYYGPRGDERVDETTPPGDDFLSRLSVEWEHAAEAAAGRGTRVVRLRTGLVLESDGGALAAMLTPFKLGVGGPLGTGRQYWPWIHRHDWIALVRFLIARPDAEGPVNATAPEPVTNREFSKTLARVLERPSLFTAPALALRLAMGEMADALLLNGQRVVPARAVEMGFEFRYRELEPALREILKQA